MISSLLLTVPKKAIIFIFAIPFLLIVIGCGPQPVPTAPPPTPTPFIYTIRIEQKETHKPIEDVHVTLEVSGQMPLDDYTDSNGIVFLRIDARQAGKVGRLIIEKNDYHFTKNLNIQQDQLPDRFLIDNQGNYTILNNTPTAVPTETSTPAKVNPTNTAVQSTQTPNPTATKPTHTPNPTSTQTPLPSGEIIGKVISSLGDTWIYAGPGTANAKLGSMRSNESAPIIGRPNYDGWYEVKTVDGTTGWVEKSHLQIIQGSASDIPVTWPPNGEPAPTSSTGTRTSPPPSTQCAKVSLDYKDWPNEDFDDITVSWSNVPANTQHFIFAVNGRKPEGNAPLVYPTEVNRNEEYFIGLWKFTERTFTTGTTFTYTLQAIASDGSVLCTTTGTFEQ